MPHELNEFVARYGVPKPDCLVVISQGQSLTVGREDDRIHPECTRLERTQFLSRDGVPEPEGPVETPRGQRLTIGREGDRTHPA